MKMCCTVYDSCAQQYANTAEYWITLSGDLTVFTRSAITPPKVNRLE